MKIKTILDFLNERIEDQGLKEQFDRETKTLSLEMLRLTCLIGMILFPLFGTLDVIVFPHLYPILWGLRAIEIGICALIYFSSGTKLIRENPSDAGMILMIVSCLNIVLMCWMTGGPASVYYAGINLTILVVIFVMILDAKRVLAACAVVYLCFMLPLIASSYDASQTASIVSNNYFLLITMVLAVLWTWIKNRTRLDALKGRLDLTKANEELKTLDSLKSQFFANVSHEVRTPLTSIIGPIQCLFQGEAGALSQEQQTLLKSMHRNSIKLLDMINQMLDFSKIEAGKMPLYLIRTDLADCLQNTVATFKPMAERKGLRLDFRQEGKVPSIQIDEVKFERILTNLVSNAIKFSEHGSILLTLSANGPWVVVDVEDTGIGLAAENFASIFERFHQVDGSSTRRFEGTGIGLALVKECVELMHGKISVTSELGRGARFRIELPMNLQDLAPKAFQDRRSAVDRRAPHSPVSDEGRRFIMRRQDDLARISIENLAWLEQPSPNLEMDFEPEDGIPKNIDRILLVEDNADLLAFIRNMLTKFGHDVSTASDGVEAWESARRDLPDLIVADIMMPRMDGFELLHNVKTTPLTAQIPVILITAKQELEAKLKGYEQGADAYLGKPINIRELDARIRNLVTLRKFQETAGQMKEMEARMEERRQGFEKLRRGLESTVQAISAVIEMRDPYTAGHQRRLADLARALGAEMGLSDDRLDGIQTAGMIHDIGKIRVPPEILCKPSKLSRLEFDLIKTHVQAGYDILKDIEFPWPIARMILEHHERMDGSGYPNGLRGEDLLPESKILAVADAVEAISSHRPYRPALGIKAALEEIADKRGILFDPEAVDACLKIFREKRYSLPE